MQSLRARTRTWRGRPAVTFYSNEPTHTAPFPSICAQVLRGTLAGLPQCSSGALPARHSHPGAALSSGAARSAGALCRRALPARSAGALCRRALPGAARSVGRGALCRARRALSGAARSLACPHCNGLTRWLDAPLSRAQVAAPSRAGAALGLRAGAHTFAPLFIVRAWAGGRTSRIAALANNSAYCRHTCSSLRSCWWCATAVRQTQQLSLLH